MKLSDYAKGLGEDDRDRYMYKIKTCGGDDPLTWGDKDLTDDLQLFPSVDEADIRDYLVHGTSFATREQWKAKKSWAHNYLTSGFVQ